MTRLGNTKRYFREHPKVSRWFLFAGLLIFAGFFNGFFDIGFWFFFLTSVLAISIAFYRKWVALVCLGLLILLIVTNPSLSSFKNYAKEFGEKGDEVFYKRDRNYLLFSVFMRQSPNENDVGKRNHEYYYGILGDFYYTGDELW